MLISRNYRGDVDPGIIEKFVPHLVDLEEEGQMAPVVDVESGVHMVFIRYNNVYGNLFFWFEFEWKSKKFFTDNQYTV